MCYFSIFFAPFLLPVVVYFITNEYEVKRDAKAALLSHVFPVVLIPVFTLLYFYSIDSDSTAFYGFLLLVVISAIIIFIVIVWNIVKGIKALLN
nr:hypothetical protein [Priestia koreensis]